MQRRQEYLNRINVFPVPDGDTGTNLAATLSSALESARVSESAGETLASISDGALVGARGNSGIILAQFLSGLSESLGRAPVIGPDNFARAAESAARCAYEAVTSPQEGTILTVMREWAEVLRAEAISSSSVEELLAKTAPALRAALERTREELPALSAAGVVDAGASGFAELVTGVRSFLAGGELASVSHTSGEPSLSIGDELDLHESGGVRFRYCTEALIAGDALDREAIRHGLVPFGDSLIVAGGERQARVHVHTDQPAQVIASLVASSRVVQQKVDDMQLQYAVAHERKAQIALVTDSVCDLPRELLDRYQIHVVPLHILFGEIEYLDKLTIGPEQFFALAAREATFPSSSQPSVRYFSRLYDYLANHYDSIIAVHIAAQLSGTAGASSKAAESIAGKTKISVIDSRHLSGSLGLVVLRAAEAIAEGKSHEEVVRAVDEYSQKAEILVSVRTLEFLVRGGRVKPLDGALARALNLKPIVSVDAEGRSILYGKAFSVRGNTRKIIEMVGRRHAANPLRWYALGHGHDLQAANDLAAKLERALGFPPLYVDEISSVAALNAGSGAVSVVTMQE